MRIYRAKGWPINIEQRPEKALDGVVPVHVVHSRFKGVHVLVACRQA